MNAQSAALRTVHDLQRQHGWAVCILTRADVESVLDRDLHDDEWELVASDKYWSRGTLFDDWPEKVQFLLEELGIDNDQGHERNRATHGA